MTKASDNAFPSLLITEGTEPSAPAAGKQRLYIDSTTKRLMRVPSTGTEVLLEPFQWSVPWTRGTSMPGSPVTGERITRTDLGLDFEYNGTRWLSTELHRHLIPISSAFMPITGSQVNRQVNPGVATLGLWVEDLVTGFLVASGGTALGASHKWVGVLATNTPTTLATVNIDSGASNAWRSDIQTIDVVVANTIIEFDLTWTKTGTPGNLYAFSFITFRLIGT